MSEVISKELLSDVLGRKCEYKFDDEDEVYYKYWIGSNEHENKINIHELAYECKMKAFQYGYCISLNMYFGHDDEIQGTLIVKDVSNDNIVFDWPLYQKWSETEAIFKAFRWILENK